MKQGESDPDKCTESRVMYPMSKSVLATPKSDSNIYFNCCILYQRQWTSMNVLMLQLASRGGALQVKQELYDSDGIVAEC